MCSKAYMIKISKVAYILAVIALVFPIMQLVEYAAPNTLTMGVKIFLVVRALVPSFILYCLGKYLPRFGT